MKIKWGIFDIFRWEITYSWTHVYIKLKTTPESLLKDYSSNHCHGVCRNWTKELIDFCVTNFGKVLILQVLIDM